MEPMGGEGGLGGRTREGRGGEEGMWRRGRRS